MINIYFWETYSLKENSGSHKREMSILKMDIFSPLFLKDLLNTKINQFEYRLHDINLRRASVLAISTHSCFSQQIPTGGLNL